MKRLSVYCVLVLCFESCAYHSFWMGAAEKSISWAENYPSVHNKDYKDQMSSWTNNLLEGEDSKVKLMKGSNEKYFHNLYTQIVKKNASILGKLENPKFYLIEHEKKFVFSLPDAQFFFSQNLFRKHIIDESILVALLSYEIIKSHLSLYRKRNFFPVGVLDVEKMMYYVHVPVDLKIKIHQIAYRVIEEAGFNASVYLNWLQIQNRYIRDFSFRVNDLKDIVIEENAFKIFLTKKKYLNTDAYLKKIRKNSSREFLEFREKMKGQMEI